MSKDQAYSKLSKSNKPIQALIDDRRAQINILEKKAVKYPYRKSKYNVAISLLKAEKDALQAKLDSHERDRTELLKFTTAHAGRLIPSDLITAWWAGKSLPYRLTSPEQVPEANQVLIPELSSDPVFIPTVSSNSDNNFEATGELPNISSGVLPFQPPTTQANMEDETGQGIPEQLEEIKPEIPLITASTPIIKTSENFNPYGNGSSANETTDISDIEYGLPDKYYSSETERFGNKEIAKNKNYKFISDSDTKRIPPSRQKQLLNFESNKFKKEKDKHKRLSFLETGEMSRTASEAEMPEKINAKNIEKYLKSYRMDYTKRPEYVKMYPNRSYVKYLNSLVKDDLEFKEYHNVVKKK